MTHRKFASDHGLARVAWPGPTVSALHLILGANWHQSLGGPGPADRAATQVPPGRVDQVLADSMS